MTLHKAEIPPLAGNGGAKMVEWRHLPGLSPYAETGPRVTRNRIGPNMRGPNKAAVAFDLIFIASAHMKNLRVC